MDFNPSRAARIDRSRRLEKRSRKFDHRNIDDDFDENLEEEIFEKEQDVESEK
jgi:hypothetical protein